jgi:hypothetical protein
MGGRHKRKTEEKLRLFSSFFTGLTNAYGTYDLETGQARQVKSGVTDKVLMAHLTGKQPYGVYLLFKDKTRAIAVDFDTKDLLPPIEFLERAKHYGLSAYPETSKSKGHHVWIFFSEKGVVARKARVVVQNILNEVEHPQTEIFPKQDELSTNMRYGNFINAPLFGKLVPEGKTIFLDRSTFNPIPDQWELLESAIRHDETILDEIIETNDLLEVPQHQLKHQKSENASHSNFGLPPCARKMLSDGVTQFQRVVCFRLAVQLKKLGIPHDLAIAALKIWASKNQPIDGKGVIREGEVYSQTSYAYKGSYSGYGCESPAIEPFCETSCSVKKWKMQHERIPSGETKDTQNELLNGQLSSSSPVA